MKRYIIVEDEQNAADYLAYQISRFAPDYQLVHKMHSVEESVKWLSKNQVDLIFLDVQLSDGNSFEIFDRIYLTTPIIFCTAFNEFAIKAFSTNSISYLLKPIDGEELQKALQKFELLYGKDPVNVKQNHLSEPAQYPNRFLISKGPNLHVLKPEEIAYLYTTNKIVILVTTEGHQFPFDITLDQMEKKLDPRHFFRINRQYIVQRDCIAKMTNLNRGRIQLEMNPSNKEEMIVSIDRSADFRKWLAY